MKLLVANLIIVYYMLEKDTGTVVVMGCKNSLGQDNEKVSVLETHLHPCSVSLPCCFLRCSLLVGPKHVLMLILESSLETIICTLCKFLLASVTCCTTHI